MSRARSGSSLDSAQSFTDPLKNVDPLYVEDAKEMESVIADLEFRLSNPDDWSIRAEAMREAMSYLKGGICDFENCDFSTLAEGIASCITDLRSTLVKTGCLLVASCARILKERYVTSIKIIIPALFKPLSHGTAIISNSCHAALIEIAKHVQHRRALSMILSSGTSRTAEHRVAVVESIIIVLQTWPGSVLAPMLGDVGLLVRKFIDDASPSVRQTAKEARVLFDERSNAPDAMPKASKIPVTSPRSKPRTPKLESQTKLSKSLTAFNRSSPMSKAQTLRSPSTLRSASPKSATLSERKPKSKASTTELSPRRASPSLSTMKRKEWEESLDDRRFSTPTKTQVRNSTASPKPQQKSPKKVVPYRPASRNAGTPERPKAKPVPASEKRIRRCFSPAPKKVDSTRKIPAQTPKTPNSVRFVDKVELPDSANGGKPKSIMKHSSSPTPTRTYRPSPVPAPPPPPQETVGIEEYMPPKSMDQAEKFQEMLTDIVDTGDYDQIVGLEDLLPQSIIAAIDFIPQFEEWEDNLRKLFAKYPEFFLCKAHDLLQAFKCKEEVISAMAECFATETLFEHFARLSKDQADVRRKFMTGFFELGYDADLSEENRERLQNVINGEGVEEEEEEGVDCKALLDDVIEKVGECHDATEEAQKLRDFLSRNPSEEIESQIQKRVMSLLSDGTEEQRKCVLALITSTSLLPQEKRIEMVLNVLSNEDNEFQRNAKAFVVQQVNDRETLVKVLKRINPANDSEVRNQAIMGCVLEYVTGLTEQKMVGIVSILFEHILPVFAWATVGLRRLAIQIAVEFNVKIPAEFSAYMGKINTAHQKLIALYTSKRR